MSGGAEASFETLLTQMRDIHRAKDADYSGAVRYGNFRGSEELGVPAHIGAALRLRDKMQRAGNLLRREWLAAHDAGPPAVTDESVEDTLLDLANYALIVYLLRQEWQKGPL